MRFIWIFFFPFIAFCTEVEFIGVEDPELFQLLQDIGDKESEVIKVLHSKAHYNAKVIREEQEELVIYFIEAGPEYLLERFDVIGVEIDLKIEGNPAYPKTIIKAEEDLLKYLSKSGYPNARIINREVIADQEKKVVYVELEVDPGSLTYFGPTVIQGLCKVKERLVRKKIKWCEGDIYDPCKIDQTICALQGTGLFDTIVIVPDSNEAVYQPMEIRVHERKHRSIGLGGSYATQRGVGLMAEWEHRNMRGIGEKLVFYNNLWLDTFASNLLYLQPDFLCPGQNLQWLAEFQHEKTKGFTETFLSLSAIAERNLDRCTRISYGLQIKQLQNTRTDNNGKFTLFKIPLQWRWSTADDVLNPKYGVIIYLKSTPSFQLLNPQFIYLNNVLTTSAYYPLNCSTIIALKSNIGTILGPQKHRIPPSERFYAGSDDTIRGYRYLSISPLDKDHDPSGGRSMMIYNLELRLQWSKTWGGVLFWDFGNVYSSNLPNFRGKLLNSVGFGIRYFTPAGPLRLDIAFPLNRRRHVDTSPLQVYLNVGQAF